MRRGGAGCLRSRLVATVSRREVNRGSPSSHGLFTFDLGARSRGNLVV